MGNRLHGSFVGFRAVSHRIVRTRAFGDLKASRFRSLLSANCFVGWGGLEASFSRGCARVLLGFRPSGRRFVDGAQQQERTSPELYSWKYTTPTV